jgi:hypothetical protein
MPHHREGLRMLKIVMALGAAVAAWAVAACVNPQADALRRQQRAEEVPEYVQVQTRQRASDSFGQPRY